MPDYVYSDGEHRQVVQHRMLYTTSVYCDACGAEMHRVPQVVAINWNGLPPSAGELSSEVQAHIDGLPASRDEFVEVHEKHEQANRSL